MITTDNLKPTITLTVHHVLNLEAELAAVAEKGGQVLAIVAPREEPNPSVRELYVSYPAKRYPEIHFNIHALVKALRAWGTMLASERSKKAEFGPGKFIADKTWDRAGPLANELNPMQNALHLLNAPETALLLLRAYQAGYKDAEAEFNYSPGEQS